MIVKKTWRVLLVFLLVTMLSLSSTISNAMAQVTQPEPDTPLNKQNLQKLSVQKTVKLENGVKFDLGTHEAYIRVFAPDMVKVSLLKKGEKEFVSRGIAKTYWKTPRISTQDSPNEYTIKTNEITVSMKKKPFGIKFLDKQGNIINEDYLQNNNTSGYENGKPYVFKKTGKNENFYGFGEQAGLQLNKRGKSIGLWNTDAYSYTKDTKYIYTTIPFFIGLKAKKAYGIFFDNTYRSYFEMASESDNYYYFYANGGKLTYYFMYGPEIADVINRYTELTGKIELPAKWTLGLHQSKWEYTADEIVNVAKTYREKKIPLDVMHFDIDYMNGYRVFTWNPVYKNALQQLKTIPGMKAISINDPAVKQDENYSVYKEGIKNDYFAKNADGSVFIGPVWPGPSAFPDFSKKVVRDWWSKNIKVLFDAGINGVWNDMNEPAVFMDEYHHTMPLNAYFGYNNNKIPHTEYHNIYGHDEAEATYNAWKMHKPNVRPFVLTRDMYAGTQRWAALWSGDSVSNWEHLQMSLPLNMNAGLSGVAFIGNDIGGFAKRPTPELFARWIQVGSFLPFSRIHYDSDRKSAIKQGQEPWAFGPEVEKISKKYIEMRYQLLPYLYNSFKEAAASGKPVQQPLVYQYQQDENTYNISDQYMFGNSMMLAPVITEGQTSRNVYLPRGDKWVDYWTKKVYNGGQTINVSAPLAQLPIFVKNNSIIPQREVQQYTDERPLTNLVLDTYVDRKAFYSFYEDDGKTYDYKKGNYNVTNLSIEQRGNKLSFKQNKMVQRYNSKLQQYTLKINNSKMPNRVQAANTSYKKVTSIMAMYTTPRSFYFNSLTKTLYVNVPVNEQREVSIQ